MRQTLDQQVSEDLASLGLGGGESELPRIDATSYAAYANVRFAATSSLRLLVGSRLTHSTHLLMARAYVNNALGSRTITRPANEPAQIVLPPARVGMELSVNW